jgi:large subunit ribosomal protein L5
MGIPKGSTFYEKERKMTVVTKNLKSKYEEEVKKVLQEEFKYENIHQIPKLSKIVLNMGVGEACHNSKLAEAIVNQLTKISGQKALSTKAKKSIAAFKLREGMPVGAMVTLRGERMYDFLQKLICVVLPRIRDFRGISAKSFDGRGNYTLGLKEQSLFPEISYDELDAVHGMNISIITTANTDEEARALLKALGMPFKK